MKSLLSFIKNDIPESGNEFYVSSDACTIQNRNHTVLKILLAVSHERKIPIKQYFCQRGPSFLKCGSIFGVIRSDIKMKDTPQFAYHRSMKH